LLTAAPPNERIDAMNEATTGFDLDEEAVFTAEVTDEALEAAAGSGGQTAAALTVAFCTGNLDCPF
jgi:hypothetical protein